MVLTKDEYGRLGEIHGLAKQIVERIERHRLFSEDPTDMYGYINECLDAANKEMELLMKVNAGLKAQRLR